MDIAGYPRAARDFSTVTVGPYVIHLRADLTPHAAHIADRLRDLVAAGAVGAGNRGGGFRIAMAGAPELFVRQARRGGAVRFLLEDLYLGLNPRPVRELTVSTEAARRGVPVAEPMGAAVQWIAPGLYRGFFMTRAVGGMTLWEFMRTDDDAHARAYVLQRAREAVEMMLQQGLYHPDLNLHNLFVTPRGENFAVIILDLDKAWLHRGALGRTARRRIAARLMRSARKLDPHQRYLDSGALAILNFA